MGVPEVGLVVLHCLISPIEAIATAIAVPVCPFELLLPFDRAYDLAVVAAAQDLQP